MTLVVFTSGVSSVTTCNIYRIIDCCKSEGIPYSTRPNFSQETTYCCAWYLTPSPESGEACRQVCSNCNQESVQFKDELLVAAVWRKEEDLDQRSASVFDRKVELKYILGSTHRFLILAIAKDGRKFPRPTIEFRSLA